MRRIAWAAAALALAAIATGTWWLFDLSRPRYDEFIERRGSRVSAKLEPPVQEPGGFLSQAVHLAADSGLRVDVRVLRPAEARAALPVVVLLGGHRTGRDAVDLVGHPGNMVLLALDYPFHGKTEPGWDGNMFRGLRAIQRALLDSPPAISVALDWLASQDWADTGRAELVGVSFGVPFAAVAGALDPRFRRVWLIHGGAGNRGWIEHNLQDRVPHAWLRPAAASLIHLLVHGASFDTAGWVARMAPRPVVIIGARDDERLPEHKVEQLYAAAGEPRELIWTEGGHVDPRRPELVRGLMSIVRERLEAEDDLR